MAVSEALDELMSKCSSQEELQGPLLTIKEAITSRDRRDAELKSMLDAKEADVVRLRAEIGRMRHAFTHVTQLNSAHAAEVDALQGQLQQAQTSSAAAERAAVLQAAVPAASTLSGQITALQAQLDAQIAANARLEADLAAAVASASSRAAELQDSFTNKVADMRRMHQEALAAVEQHVKAIAGAGAQGAVSAAQAEVAAARQQTAALQDQVLALTARLEAQQAAVARLSEQLEARAAALNDMQSARDAALRRAVAAESEITRLRPDLMASQGECQALKNSVEQLKAQGHGGSGGIATEGAGPGAAELHGMLGMMEGQLQRLSELVRAKDSEVAELRRAVQAGCEERRDLTRQLETLNVAGPPASPAPLHPKSPGSPTGSAGTLLGGGRPGGMNSNKPYRTGLVSKPKFK